MADLINKIDKTIRYHTKTIQRGLRGKWWDITHPAADRPVIVLGCSRAGTTVVYKTLSESPQLGTLQRETHDFWIDLHPVEDKHWNTHALDASDATEKDREFVTRYFYSWTGHSRWVDKNNQNGLCVPYLRTLFPDAVFVYVKRSPGDNINSLIEGWGKPDKYATWSGQFPVQVAIDNGRYTQWCFFLAEGWRNFPKSPIEEVAAFHFQYHAHGRDTADANVQAINYTILDAYTSRPARQWGDIFHKDWMYGTAAGEIKLDKGKEGRNYEHVEHVLQRVSPVTLEIGYPD